MFEQQIINLLGLATRARKTICGTEKILSALRSNKVYLLLIAEDASERTKQKLIEYADYQGITWQTWGTAESLAQATGNSHTIAVAIIEKGFAKAIKQKMKND